MAPRSGGRHGVGAEILNYLPASFCFFEPARPFNVPPPPKSPGREQHRRRHEQQHSGQQQAMDPPEAGPKVDGVRVAVRVRPLMEREKTQSADSPLAWRVTDAEIAQSYAGKPVPANSFLFDHVFNQVSTNEQVFDSLARPIVHAAIEGYNSWCVRTNPHRLFAVICLLLLPANCDYATNPGCFPFRYFFYLTRPLSGIQLLRLWVRQSKLCASLHRQLLFFTSLEIVPTFH